MRHIPEPELHAYLDQALSRSQCVEIERHLAACAACHMMRDEIAALRDRTTALLASLTPAPPHVPPFEMLRQRNAGEQSARRRQRQRLAWAASVAGGIGLGWLAATLFGGKQTPIASTLTPAAPKAAVDMRELAPPTPAVARPPQSGQASAPPAVPMATQQGTPQGRTPSRASPRNVATAPAAPDSHPAAPASTPVAALPSSPGAAPGSTDSAHPVGDVVMSGAWKKVSWDSARAEAGGKAPPHVDGLPVVEVQVQKNQPGDRATMVVAQQLASGEVIRTIEGPAADVSKLLGRRVMTDPKPDSNPIFPPPPLVPANRGRHSGGLSMAMQRGDRMVIITGALPSDSLRAMIRRLHAGQVEQEPSATPTAPNAARQAGPGSQARPTLPAPQTPPPPR